MAVRTPRTPAPSPNGHAPGADDAYTPAGADHTPDGIITRMLERTRREGAKKKTAARDTIKTRPVAGAPEGVDIPFSAPGVPGGLTAEAFARHYGSGVEVKTAIKVVGTGRAVPTVLMGESAASQYADALAMPTRE
jgi:hypothetical protein